MKQTKRHFYTHSSLQTHKKLHKKIADHIKEMSGHNRSVLSQKSSKPQNIPSNIIQKNRHKYLYKKSLINTKFQWLNKFIQTSQLKPLSVNLKTKQVNYSFLRDRHSKTSALSNKNRCITQDIHKNNQSQQFEQFDGWKNCDLKKNEKRAKTQNMDNLNGVTDIEQYQYLNSVNPNQHVKNNNKEINQKIEKQLIDQEGCYQLLKQINTNSKLLFQKNFQLKKSKSTKETKTATLIRDQNSLNQMLMKQRKKNVSQGKKYSLSKILSCKQNIDQKQNKNNLGFKKNIKAQRMQKICVQLNSPVQQFLQSSSRLQSSNLTSNKTSGYIKNRKREYIYQSRQRQQSQFLKRKRKIQEEITVEPWYLGQNDKDNIQDEILF